MAILETDTILPEGAISSARERDRQDPGLRTGPKAFRHRASDFLLECWQSMRVMNAAFKHSESGCGSQEPSGERLRDEQAGSRMNDEGCPNQPLIGPSAPSYTSDPQRPA
jgi:hypothetical protein